MKNFTLKQFYHRRYKGLMCRFPCSKTTNWAVYHVGDTSIALLFILTTAWRMEEEDRLKILCSTWLEELVQVKHYLKKVSYQKHEKVFKICLFLTLVYFHGETWINTGNVKMQAILWDLGVASVQFYKVRWCKFTKTSDERLSVQRFFVQKK